MAKGRPFTRQRRRRAIGRKIIIACEGEKTEFGYFEAIRQFLRLPTVQVVVIKPAGSDPRTVVEASLEQKEIRVEERNWIEGDSAWAVFDGDEHIAHNPKNWHEALDLANSNGIGLAVSNPCFELWYLLHYQDQFGNLTRHTARQLLKKHRPEYNKAHVLYPDPLRSLTQAAIDRAKQIDHRAQVDSLPPHTNPCTEVWQLVENLLHLQAENP